MAFFCNEKYSLHYLMRGQGEAAGTDPWSWLQRRRLGLSGGGAGKAVPRHCARSTGQRTQPPRRGANTAWADSRRRFGLCSITSACRRPTSSDSPSAARSHSRWRRNGRPTCRGSGSSTAWRPIGPIIGANGWRRMCRRRWCGCSACGAPRGCSPLGYSPNRGSEHAQAHRGCGRSSAREFLPRHGPGAGALGDPRSPRQAEEPDIADRCRTRFHPARGKARTRRQAQCGYRGGARFAPRHAIRCSRRDERQPAGPADRSAAAARGALGARHTARGRRHSR